MICHYQPLAIILEIGRLVHSAVLVHSKYNFLVFPFIDVLANRQHEQWSNKNPCAFPTRSMFLRWQSIASELCSPINGPQQRTVYLDRLDWPKMESMFSLDYLL